MVNGFEQRQFIRLAFAQNMIRMHHLRDTVEKLDLARDNARLACGQHLGQVITTRMKEHKLETGLRILDVDPVSPALIPRRTVVAHCDFDGQNLGQFGTLNRLDRTSINHRIGQREQQITRRFYVQVLQVLGNLGPDTVQRL